MRTKCPRSAPATEWWCRFERRTQLGSRLIPPPAPSRMKPTTSCGHQIGYEPLFKETGLVRAPRASRTKFIQSFATQRRICPIWRFLRRVSLSWWPSGPSGKRRPRSPSSAARSGGPASGCPGTRTISRALTRPALQDARWSTARFALSVARHKAMFFSENDASGTRIDYEAAVSGDRQLVSAGTAHAVLVGDYARLLADGMLLVRLHRGKNRLKINPLRSVPTSPTPSRPAKITVQRYLVAMLTILVVNVAAVLVHSTRMRRGAKRGPHDN